MSYAWTLFLKCGVSFLSAFLAIWVWTRNRQEGWLFIVLGSLFHFMLLLLEALSLFGVLPYDYRNPRTLPLWLTLMQSVPYLMYSSGFLFFIRKNRLF